MRNRKTLRLLALVGFLWQTTGCYSFGPVSPDLPTEPGPATWRTVVVTQAGGQRIELAEPWMDSLWIGGVSELIYPDEKRMTEVRFALDEVQKIEEKLFSRNRTLALVGLAVGFAAILPLTLADAFGGTSPGPGPGG